MSTWSALLAETLGESTSGARVERLSVVPGEVSGLVRGPGSHEVSLIRTVPSDAEWERLCAALASQPVFAARLLAGELPVEAARVFSLLGWDLVPRGWGELVATCSCERWDSRCAHLAAAVAELGTRTDRDPFTLTRWLGRERRTLMTQVRALSSSAVKSSSEAESAFTGMGGTTSWETADPSSAGAFWSAPALPSSPTPPKGAAGRIRATAPGIVADDLPDFGSPEAGTRT